MTNATATTPSGQPLGISHKPSPTEAMFDEFKAANKPAFIGYLPYGFPDSDYSLKAFRTMAEHGVDAVEIGLPYSDPVMDGPGDPGGFSQIALEQRRAHRRSCSRPWRRWPTPGECRSGDELLEPHLPLRGGTLRTLISRMPVAPA